MQATVCQLVQALICGKEPFMVSLKYNVPLIKTENFVPRLDFRRGQIILPFLLMEKHELTKQTWHERVVLSIWLKQGTFENPKWVLDQ